VPTGRVLLRVTNKHAGRRRRRRYAQTTTRSKTTQHSIHDNYASRGKMNHCKQISDNAADETLILRI